MSAHPATLQFWTAISSGDRAEILGFLTKRHYPGFLGGRQVDPSRLMIVNHTEPQFEIVRKNAL